MSNSNSNSNANSSFSHAFLPGLILGLIVGGVAGAMLPDLLSGPNIPTQRTVTPGSGDSHSNRGDREDEAQQYDAETQKAIDDAMNNTQDNAQDNAEETAEEVIDQTQDAPAEITPPSDG